MAARALHHVEPVFPVTLAPGASVRILLRVQDMSVPTTFVDAWTPDDYTRALSWTLVHETVTLTVCLLLVGLLLATADQVRWQLSGLLLSAECFSATFHGQLLPYFLPGIVGHLIPAFTISAALCQLLFTLSSRTLLNIGRRGVWAWVLGGINALALLAAVGTLFTVRATRPAQAGQYPGRGDLRGLAAGRLADPRHARPAPVPCAMRSLCRPSSWARRSGSAGTADPCSSRS